MADQKLNVILGVDSSRFNASLGKAQGRLKAFGSKLKSVGSTLSTRLSLPLALAGGAAIKMAVDFDKSMTQIKTLVGIAGDEVDAMGLKVKQLASQTGKSSNEAAEALFFITSAGLRGAEAMETLEMSLKASALGLGETKTVADLATSAMNAYGSDVLGASDATDVLVSAVREGKIEASELSSVMGQVLPVASNMGVAFHEVGGAFAAMSRTGTPAAQAATQLNAILSALLKTTPQAEKALGELNLSSAGLKKQIKDEGLLSVLKTLKDASIQNEEAFLKVFGSIRAVKGVLDLTGKSAATTAEIMHRMADSAGITAEANEVLEKSASHQLQKSFKELQNIFTEVGSVLLTALLPAIKKIGNLIVGVSNNFKKLNPEIQNFILIAGGIAVVIGPVLTILGSLATVIAALTGPIGLTVIALSGMLIFFDDIANALLLFKENIKLFILDSLVKVKLFFDKYLFLPLKTAGKLLSEFKNSGFGGDFTNILNNAFKEGEDLSKKAGQEMANNLTNWTQNLKTGQFKGTLKNFFQGAMKNLPNFMQGGGGGQNAKVKTKTNDFSSFSADTSGLGSTLATNPLEGVSGTDMLAGFETNAMRFDEVSQKMQEKMQGLRDVANAVGTEVGGAFGTMAEGLIGSMGLADTGFEGFAKNIMSTIAKIISMMLSQSIAQAIAGATASGAASGPAAVFTTPAFIATAVGGVMSAFAAIPKFANGGIVSGPTLGLMGEYSGAKSNPEVIAPLNKLEGMIGQKQTNVNVGGNFRIQGQDLVLALQKADKQRNRII